MISSRIAIHNTNLEIDGLLISFTVTQIATFSHNFSVYSTALCSSALIHRAWTNDSQSSDRGVYFTELELTNLSRAIMSLVS